MQDMRLVSLLAILLLATSIFSVPASSQNPAAAASGDDGFTDDSNSMTAQATDPALDDDGTVVGAGEPGQECVGEGETMPVTAARYGCCEGLTVIGCDRPIDGKCSWEATGNSDVVGRCAGASYCTYCGDGECKSPENKCNCPVDCYEDMCVPAGQSYHVTPETKDYECCEGSSHIAVAYVIDNGRMCSMNQEWSLCSECGNGACEPWENICNCHADCTAEEDSACPPGCECDPYGNVACTEEACPTGCVCEGEDLYCPTDRCPEGCVCSDDTVTCTSIGPSPVSGECPVGCVCDDEGNSVMCRLMRNTASSSGDTLRVREGENSISVEGYNGTLTRAKLTVSFGDKDEEVQIERPSTGPSAVVRSGGSAVSVNAEIAVRDQKLFMATSSGEAEVRVSPERVAERVRQATMTRVTEMALAEDASGLQYTVRGEKDANILGMIPVKMDVSAKVSADNGEVVSSEGPWWSFLAW